jgi:hypothetical protein
MESTEQNVEEITMDGSIDAVANSLLVSLAPEPKKAKPVEEAIDDAEDEQPEESEEIEEELDEDESSDDLVDDEDDSVVEKAKSENEDSKELFTVKVDGQEQKVTLDDLKRSFSGQAYIQKGMQEASQQKKQVEETYQALLYERQQLNDLLQQAQPSNAIPVPVPPTRALFQNDPVAYMEAKLAYDEDKVAYDNQQNQFAKYQQQQSQYAKQAFQTQLQSEMQKLTEKLPAIKDPEKGAKFKDNLISYGEKIGYSQDELDSVVDHRAILVLHKARLYDKLMASKPEANKKASLARPMVKAGAKKSPNSSSNRKKQDVISRMKKTGSIDDVANFLIS